MTAKLLDGLASDLPSRLLIELQLLGANMHSAQCLRERVAHEFGAGHPIQHADLAYAFSSSGVCVFALIIYSSRRELIFADR
jgi:hypothetical protein